MLESLRKASAWPGLSDLNQGGFSCFLELGGPPSVVTGVAPPIGIFPLDLAKDVAFLVLETVWALVWEEQLWMAVLLQGESLVVGWVEVMGCLPLEEMI